MTTKLERHIEKFGRADAIRKLIEVGLSEKDAAARVEAAVANILRRDPYALR